MEGGNGSILVQSVECFPAQVALPQNVLVYETALAPSVFIVVLVHPKSVLKKILEMRITEIFECLGQRLFLYF